MEAQTLCYQKASLLETIRKTLIDMCHQKTRNKKQREEDRPCTCSSGDADVKNKVVCACVCVSCK